MQFYFIRHAQSANNALYAFTGSDQGRNEDPAITDLGIRQAEALADFLAQGNPSATQRYGDLQNRGGFRLTHLYTSLMLRSVMTAAPVARRLGLSLQAWKDLHENGGIYLTNPITGLPEGLPGKPRSFFAEHYPELLLPEDFSEAGWWNRPYETPEERNLRAKRVLDLLVDRHGDTEDRVGVVSHGGFYNRLLGAILQLRSREGLWFMLNNCAITRVDFKEDEISLVYHNRADFLPADLVT